MSSSTSVVGLTVVVVVVVDDSVVSGTGLSVVVSKISFSIYDGIVNPTVVLDVGTGVFVDMGLDVVVKVVDCVVVISLSFSLSIVGEVGAWVFSVLSVG